MIIKDPDDILFFNANKGMVVGLFTCFGVHAIFDLVTALLTEASYSVTHGS